MSNFDEILFIIYIIFAVSVMGFGVVIYITRDEMIAIFTLIFSQLLSVIILGILKDSGVLK
jgi:hypothetical protein